MSRGRRPLLYRPRVELGVTLAEVLVAGTVLGFLTLIGFSILVPTLRKAKWNDRTQDRLQGFVVARTTMSHLLSPARLLEPIGPESIQYFLPKTVPSRWGDIPISAVTETLAWQEEDIHTIVVEQGKLLRFTSEPQGTRVLWNLGEGGSMAVSQKDGPLVEFHFSLPAVEDSLAWEAGFTLYLRGVP